ncbi:hypothetical protein [Candidatus Nitrosocosmicus oleophilus]|nr:hypothetical protein [Candidatus Nitrosocosmicus oleophilus]
MKPRLEIKNMILDLPVVFGGGVFLDFIVEPIETFDGQTKNQV